MGEKTPLKIVHEIFSMAMPADSRCEKIEIVCVKLCLNLRLRNCEKVPVKHFEIESSRTVFKHCRRRFDFFLNFCFTFRFGIIFFRGNFVLLRRQPKNCCSQSYKF